MRILLCACGTPLWLALAPAASAITASALQSQLAQGTNVTIIDVRSQSQYASEHIPGAICVPALLCPLKNLPLLGRVIIYDAGLGRDATDQAAAALTQKQGISVEILEGGLAAWKSAVGVTTRQPGLAVEARNYISYADLKRSRADEIVLLDLRHPSSTSRHPSSKSPPALTDLSAEFPAFKQAAKPFDPKPSAASARGTPPLLVLIDDADGASEAMARTLRGNGNHRYVILAGGEIILARHGQPGLSRVNGAYHPDQAPTPTR